MTRLIFSANPGRSGSGYLAQLLDATDEIDAGHERIPTMTGPWLRRVAHLGLAESRNERELKVEAIRYELELVAEGVAYCDTTHMFVKTFADVVLDAFPHTDITVIGLARDPVLTAHSYYSLGILGPNRDNWHDWMVCPTAPAARFRLRAHEVEGQFDLIFGSLVDQHARALDLRRAYAQVQWIDVDLESISTPDGADGLFDRLGVTPPVRAEPTIGEPTNTKSVEKSRTGVDVEHETVRRHLVDFVSRFGHRPEVRAFVHDHSIGVG